MPGALNASVDMCFAPMIAIDHFRDARRQRPSSAGVRTLEAPTK
ncbi:conserved hypothetical protein [Burkholderia pseudomallei MSHR346]|uniref:Uncharacterized protein n=1 Tax=Burkholderia pseudomallei 1710a TaxID=320371 RepID=A0A0E1VUI2_BURPE|nr:hypothetical protein BURPSPAST_D0464 [Burkholderia pseudomallei Pasteur 52237]EEP49237.1 conserved hypothetical protein [Burkholderia pseudomallei MSHR346]EET03651.1 hypothetical protein BURPS1710A_A3162 [Burkholderia pseudomallei 1710a]